MKVYAILLAFLFVIGSIPAARGAIVTNQVTISLEGDRTPGAYIELNKTGACTFHYQCLSTADGNTTYVWTVTPVVFKSDSYNITRPGAGHILSIWFMIYARSTTIEASNLIGRITSSDAGEFECVLGAYTIPTGSYTFTNSTRETTCHNPVRTWDTYFSGTTDKYMFINMHNVSVSQLILYALVESVSVMDLMWIAFVIGLIVSGIATAYAIGKWRSGRA